MARVEDSARVAHSEAAWLFQGLDDLRRQRIMCDVVIVVEDEEIAAHKVVLAAASPYFRAMLADDSWRESREGRVHLVDLDAASVRQLIDYIYSNVLNVSGENVLFLLHSAVRLQLSRAIDKCEGFLRSHLSAENALTLLGQAELLGLRDLQKACRKLASQRFMAVARSDSFLALPGPQLLKLLESPTTAMPCESVALAAALRWLQHDPEGRNELAEQLISAVRLAYVPARSLSAGLQHPVLEHAPTARQKLLEFHRAPTPIDQMASGSPPPPRPGLVAGIICLGGYSTQHGRITYVDRYDNRNQRWVPMMPMLTPRSYLTAVAAASSIYAIGGYIGGTVRHPSGDLTLDSVERYDVLAQAWSQEVPLTTKRARAAGAAYNNIICVAGGVNGTETPLNSVEILNLAHASSTQQWQSVAPLHEPRFNHGMAALNGKLYVVGGENSQGLLTSVECFDPELGVWEIVAPLNVPRTGLAVCASAFNNRLYAAGGVNDGTTLAVMEEYDPETNTWTQCADMLEPRRGLALAASDEGFLLAMGGVHYQVFESAERFDIAKNCWTPVLDMPWDRRGCAAVTMSLDLDLLTMISSREAG